MREGARMKKIIEAIIAMIMMGILPVSCGNTTTTTTDITTTSGITQTTATTTGLSTTSTTTTTEPVTTYAVPELEFAAEQDVYTSNDDGLVATVSLHSAPLLAVRIDGYAISSDVYILQGTTLTLLPAAFISLMYGTHSLSVTTAGGTAADDFIYNDIPFILTKNNFIKLPGETVTNEDFTVLAVNLIGECDYEIVLSTGEGTLTDHGNGHFDYVPAGIAAGTVVFTFIVTDTYGAMASRNITLTYKTVNPAAIADQEFDLDDPADVVFAVDLHGGESTPFSVLFADLSGHGITAADYILDDSTGTVTIRSAFLSGLEPGIYEFLLQSTCGERSFAVIVRANPAVTVREDGVYTIGSDIGIRVDVDLKGADFEAIYRGEILIDAADYAFDGTLLTLNPGALAILTPGLYEYRLVSASGYASFSIFINDVPVIAAKTDFIKMPGETVTNESFAYLVTDSVGTCTYRYELASGGGTLIDHGDGTFDYAPASTFAGEVVITFTVTDSYGAEAVRDITLTYKTVDPVIYDAIGQKVVDKIDAFGDIVMTVDTYGHESSAYYYEMTDVRLAGLSIGTANYLFKTGADPRLFSIRADYLMTLPTGIHEFTLKTEAGSAVFTIEVRDTRAVEASPAILEYTKTVSAADAIFTITPYAHTVGAGDFAIAGTVWTNTVDYAYVGGILTIYQSFLEGLDAGIYPVTVGGASLLTITVKNPTAPNVDPASETTTLEHEAIAGDLVIGCNLYGLAASSVLMLAGVPLGSANYDVVDDAITLHPDYLATLAYGTHVFTITNAHGSDTFTLRISDLPTAGASQNVTKFTYESILAEAFRVTAAGAWGTASYRFVDVTYYPYVSVVTGAGIAGVVAENGKSVSGSFGTVTISDATDSFAFTRAAGWFGIVVFTYRATDGAGIESDPIAMDILYLQMAPVIADATGKVFVAGGADVVWSITNASGDSDFAVWKILAGDTELELGRDYTVGIHEAGIRYFSLTADYLETLTIGTHAFTLYTEGGRSGFSVTVAAGISTSSSTAEFDKNDPQDLLFTLTGFPLDAVTFTRGGVALAPAYYDFTDGVLSILATFLSVQGYGDLVIRAANAYGYVDLTITIVDSRSPVLGAGPFAYTEHSLLDLEVGITLYDNVLTSLSYGETTVALTDYDLTAGILTLHGDYLETIAGGHLELVFLLHTTDGDRSLSVAVEPNTALPVATLLSDAYTIDLPNDIQYGIDLQGNEFSHLTAGGVTLTEGSDYLWNAETNILIVYGAFLVTRYQAGDTGITFVFRTVDGNDLGVSIPLDHPENRIINGGFESGDLSGWTGFSLWKDEPGMIAWTDERVVSGTYFDPGYTYNRDGVFNLGIYGGSITKDSGQERMGYLRSADFVLGGSGWIGFKLGGGANAAFAYVSVRRCSDDVEVARFGNRHFGDTVLSGTANAEAYLFPYYYDLSQVATAGGSYYLVIADTASNLWSVLAADSFQTYFTAAPTTTADTIAENIVPVVAGIDTATNEIKNGSFSDGLTGWTNPSGAFQIVDGYAISSVGGNGATGILRSSAFSVVGMKYLRFDWAGALTADKQIWISVKEVGTNIEVLRFVRRDNLSTKRDGTFDNHMLDLSGLDESKLYYLEICDNVDGDWGVQKIDSIRFVSESEWNAVVATDRAVSIAGIPQNFSVQ